MTQREKRLTPYDTGARLQPQVWVSADGRRPTEDDDDRYGKVDFDNDESATLGTVHAERVDGTYVVVVYSHETNTEARVNLNANLDIYDVSSRPPQPGALTAERLVELLREHGEGGDWIDTDASHSDVVIDGRFNLTAIVAAINGAPS